MIMHGTRYILQFDSEKFGHEYKILIKEAGYSGTAEKKSLGSAPLLRRDDSDSGISGTSLEMVIQADEDGELASLYTVDNKKFLVELYKNDSLIWTGYVLPEKYSEPYIPVPYDVSVTASDGLGILKNIQYAQAGTRSIFDIIKYCCDQTSLALGFETSFSLIEKTMSRTESVLHQTTLNTGSFSDMTCYEVLEKCMTSLDCFITQHAGRWLICSLVDVNKDGYIYNNPGSKTGNSKRVKKILGSTGDDCYPIGSLTNEIIPASKAATFIYDYNKRPSFLSNYDFRKELEGWSVEGKAMYSHSVNDVHFVNLSERGSVYQRVDVEKTTQVLSIAVNYCSSTNPIYWGGQIPETGSFNITIKLTDGTTTKYLSLEEGWRDTEYSFSRSSTTKKLQMFQQYPFSDSDFEKLEITADGFPFSGQLEIKFQDTTNLSNVKNHVTNVVVTHVVSGGIDVNVNLVEAASENHEDVQIAFGDTPFTENADLLFNNVLHVKNGGFTSEWMIGEKTDSFLYTILKSTCSRIGFPRRQLSGIIQGHDLQTFMLLSDKYSDTLFHVKSASLNLLADEMDVTLEQFMPYRELSGEMTESTRVTGGSASEYRSSGENEIRVYQGGTGVPMRITDLSPSGLKLDSVIEVDRANVAKSGKATLQKLLEFILETGSVWTEEKLKVVEGYILYLGEKIKSGDSDLWAGNSFEDYLDQAVRSSDPVQFKSVIADYLKSKDFASGLTGFKVGEDTEVETLKVRGQFWAEEYILNQISLIGDEFILTEGGQVDGVEPLEGGRYKVTLSENSVRAGQLKAGDICVTDFKLETGFRRIYFEITKVGNDNTIEVYPKDPAYPPRPLMTFRRRGNFTDETRQNSIRLSSHDQVIEMLSGVNSYDVTWKNRDILIGKIKDLIPEIKGLPERARQKATFFGQNMVLLGNVFQVSADGVTQERIPCYKGLWTIEKAPFFYYDQVTDGYCRYTCIHEGEDGTMEAPRFDSDVWQVSDGDTTLNMKMYSSAGAWEFWDPKEILFDASAKVFAGSKPINDLVNEWEWWIETGNEEFDASWKSLHGSKTDTQHVDGETFSTYIQPGVPVKLWCKVKIFNNGKTSIYKEHSEL